MGYELLVTPIQLAAAYAAIANDGVLLAPALIKEVRGHDGQVIYRHRASVVRRVISSEVAATLRQYLASAATDSTPSATSASTWKRLSPGERPPRFQRGG